MVPEGIFKVGPYECYAGSYNGDTVNVVLVDSFAILQAERAVSTVARLLNSGHVELGRISVANGTRYSCMVKDVKVKELNKWLA